jgi:DNA-binding Lrp family transcriptional regulator
MDGERFSTKTIDAIDAKILRDLLKDGRKDFVEIAEEIGVSKSAIWKHYREMEKSGIIIGATTQVDIERLGFYSVAEIVAKIDIAEKSRIEELIQKIPNAIFANNFIEGKNVIVILLYIRDLSEIENTKRIIANHVYSGEMKTYIWTSEIRNIPENLSFGLPETGMSEVFGKQTEPTINIQENVNEIDETDVKIIDKLTENARSPFRAIAKDLGVTTDTVARRYKKLKRSGTMKTVIQICPERIGYHANLECRIRLKSRENLSLTIEAISKIPDVYHIAGITGDCDLHVWALIRDIEHLFATQIKIAAVPDFGSMDIDLNRCFLNMYPNRKQHITTSYSKTKKV